MTGGGHGGPEDRRVTFEGRSTFRACSECACLVFDRQDEQRHRAHHERVERALDEREGRG